MRAIKIDPRDKSITEVEYTGEYRNIYVHIEAECFDIVQLGDKDQHTFFVDDNGLNNNKIRTHGMFRIDGDYPAYLAGPALILAHDDEGDSVAATLSIDDVKKIIAFGMPMRVGSRMLFMALDSDDVWNMDR